MYPKDIHGYQISSYITSDVFNSRHSWQADVIIIM